LGRTVSFIVEGGGIFIVGFTSSSPIDTPESRGLNRRETVPCAGSKASCRGLTSSKTGGSAGEKVDAGGVRAENEAREELEFEKSGRGPRLPGDKERARPDFWPNEREIEDEAGRLWCSPELIRLCARPFDVPVDPLIPGLAFFPKP